MHGLTLVAWHMGMHGHGVCMDVTTQLKKEHYTAPQPWLKDMAMVQGAH